MTTGAAPGLLHDFFTRTAAEWPHRIAVDVPPGRLRPARHRATYAELDGASNALARRLALFVQGECIVAILLPRATAHLYEAQLAVLKAGAAYTCFDLAFPDERLRDTIADAHPVALLTDAAGRARALAAGYPAERIIDVVQAHREGGDARPFPRPRWLTPNSLAYVIYTSGTTGKPKGVMIEHASICNLVASDRAYFALSADDRAAQASSPAYDSSVEETWLAFAVGATLVVMDEDTTRLGPDLVGWLRHERITVFCPPPTLLRATGCEDPASELPDLKFLYVGGEALPQDVADRWSVSCALVNGYGPTECSVTVTRMRVVAGQPVTIGHPVDNVRAHIVDDAFNAVADGVTGELLIAGAALARGYWNKPELTAERFAHHPEFGRVYRTGDIAHRDPDGTLTYYGRGDAQVKLRGYRVELGAIEAALAACDGVREAACTVQGENGRQSLVAFIVPEAMVPVPDAADLQQVLRATLPDYMVPARFATIDMLPVSLSGKLDRKALPILNGTAPNGNGNGHGHAPTDAIERLIAERARTVLRHDDVPGIHDDFFTALGGDSLGAAELITALRDEPSTATLDVRDVYEARTIAGLAARARERAGSASTRTPAHEARADVPVTRTTVMQALSLLRSLVVGSAVLWIGAMIVLPPVIARVGVVLSILLAPVATMLAMLLWAPVSVWLAVLAKRSLIGEYRATRERVWGPYFLKHWMVQQSARSIPWTLLEGTELQCMALRALGARIGQRVHIHRGVKLTRGGWDLLTIGDDVTLSQDASLRLVELVDGDLVVAPVTLGHRATVGLHAGVGGHCIIGDDAVIADNASVPGGTTVGAGELWDGLPAQCVGQAPPVPARAPARELGPVAYGALELTVRLVLSLTWSMPVALLAGLVIARQGVSDAAMLDGLLGGEFGVRGFVVLAGVEALAVPMRLVLDALACRALGRVRDGVHARWSAGYVRIWLKPMLVDAASRWLYGTLFWPYWLRLAGMRVGRDCEISSLIDTVPESVTIGSRNFFADGIYVGNPVVRAGTVTVAHTTFGSNTFLGNGVIVPAGTTLPDDILLGICTRADPARMRSGTAWFGNPAFELPHREIIEYDAAFTFDPTPWRYAVRLFWEASRFVIATLPVITALLWFRLLGPWADAPLWQLLLFVVPLVTLASGALFAVSIIVLKWALLGRVQPAMHPLWSSWASRWDLMCLAWNVCAGGLVSQLDGTLMLNALLRLTGVKIGRRVVLGGGFAEDLPDPDMLTFEDGATIDCLFQAHTFEDRVLKMDRVTIRRDATVGDHAVLLYGADIGPGARVAPHSVVVKHEHLRPGLTYAGFPTRPAQDGTAW